MDNQTLKATIVDSDPDGLTAHVYESAGSAFPYLVVYSDTGSGIRIWSKAFKAEGAALMHAYKNTNNLK
jgi:hypothetical protein